LASYEIFTEPSGRFNVIKVDDGCNLNTLWGETGELGVTQSRSRKDAILEAAADLVREKGALHLTLDSVAARAHISKGGLLYHFKTKEALLQSMVARLESAFTRDREAELAKLPPSPARTLKAHIISMGAVRQKDAKSVAAALLAAGSYDPKLLENSRRFYYEPIIKEIEAAGISPAFVNVVVSAVKGMLLSEMLGTAVYSKKERKAFIAEIIRLINEEAIRACPQS